MRLMIIVGSVRPGRIGLPIARWVEATAAAREGVDVDLVDLAELALPLMDEPNHPRLQQYTRPHTRAWSERVAAADAVILVTPEYNGFPTPLFVNAFDWLSRIPATDALPSGLAATAGKPVALLSASPGPGGALRSMNFVRQYLQMAFAMLVVPQQFALGRAHEAFDEEGGLKEARTAQAVQGVVQALAKLAGALRAAA